MRVETFISGLHLEGINDLDVMLGNLDKCFPPISNFINIWVVKDETQTWANWQNELKASHSKSGKGAVIVGVRTKLVHHHHGIITRNKTGTAFR